MDWAGSLGGSVLVVAALIEVLKRSSLGRVVPPRDWAVAAIGLGVVFTFLAAFGVPDNEMGDAPIAAIVICGIIVGLAASGAFEAVKAQTQRRDAPAPEGERTDPRSDADGS